MKKGFWNRLLTKARILSVKIDNSTNEKLHVIHTDQLGNKWYAYKDVLEISPQRGIAASRADRFVGLRISQYNMEALLDNAIEGINKRQDFVNSTAILHELKLRTHFLCEESSLLDLAGIYYFLENEDPRFPDDKAAAMKREIWQKDSECKGFFLHMSIQLTNQFSDTPVEDLLKFIHQSTHLAERIYQFIPRT